MFLSTRSDGCLNKVDPEYAERVSAAMKATSN